MKIKELRDSFDRIRPREELISSTVARVEEYKARRERRFAWLYGSFGMRLAGALCAFALMFTIGFSVARQMTDTPSERTLADLSGGISNADGVISLSSAREFENGYIVINGMIEGISFTDLKESDAQSGAIRRCKISVTAEALVEISDTLTVDLHNTNEAFVAEMVFYDDASMNAFFDQSTNMMMLCLTPDGSGNWTIVEFASAEK